MWQDKTGLLPTLDSFCEHGHRDGCCDLEKFYIFMPHAHSDLSISFWGDLTIPRQNKLQLLRELLEGLQTLHEMGIMHRDIRCKNMLIMSLKPPRASLCDYGKAIQAQYSTVTAIGAIPTCAPEVWTAAHSYTGYNNKIDMWAFGHAIAQILVFTFQKPEGSKLFFSPHQITEHQHSKILQMLRIHCRHMSEDEALVDLVFKLLVWKPEERWSAEQALQHHCWSPITQQEEKKNVAVEETGGTKRSATSVDDSKSADKRTKGRKFSTYYKV